MASNVVPDDSGEEGSGHNSNNNPDNNNNLTNPAEVSGQSWVTFLLLLALSYLYNNNFLLNWNELGTEF